MVETEINRCTTTYLPFSQPCPDGPPLLAVRHGVPLVIALEEVSSYLSLSLSLIGDAAILHEDSPCFAAARLLEVSEAVLDSLANSAGRAERIAVECK